MRHVIESRPYRRDIKRAGRGIYSRIIEEELPEVIYALANDEILPVSFRDHALHGNWEGSRDCHIRPDFVLVYRYDGDEWLTLQRLASHSEIFGL